MTKLQKECLVTTAIKVTLGYMLLMFLLETLIMESMEKETAFDKMLKDISDVFDLVDSIGDDVAMPNKIKSVLSLVPKIVSIVGRFVKIAADSFEK